MFAEDSNIKDKFREEGIKEIDIRKVLGEIFKRSPIIGMPIDYVSNDLKEWAETLKNDVRLWIVKKYTQFGNPDKIAYEIPEEYRPVLDTTDRNEITTSGIHIYDVSLTDLLDSGFLSEGNELSLIYKPRGGKRKTYRGTITSDGSIEVLNQTYSSPSYAALACIQDAGSDRKTVNGWTSWKSEDGKLLSDIRENYLKNKENEAERIKKNEGELQI